MRDGIVFVRAHGNVSAEAGNAMMAAASEAARANATSRYLFDFRDAILRESYIALYGRPEVARSVGIDRLAKTAVLGRLPDEKLKFTENVAVNRGIDLKLFDDESAAVAWLLA